MLWQWSGLRCYDTEGVTAPLIYKTCWMAAEQWKECTVRIMAYVSEPDGLQVLGRKITAINSCDSPNCHYSVILFPPLRRFSAAETLSQKLFWVMTAADLSAPGDCAKYVDLWRLRHEWEESLKKKDQSCIESEGNKWFLLFNFRNALILNL